MDAVSVGPSPRGFHAMWRAGFKIVRTPPYTVCVRERERERDRERERG